jgi:DNA-binding CsgD family transcriptional regulator
VWLGAREAIDAGSTEAALKAAREQTTANPYGTAVLHCIEAAIGHDAARWQQALEIAARHELLLIAIDALEGLGVDAAGAESWAEALRLLGAAERLRSATGYRWRFAGEQAAVDDAIAKAVVALGDAADVFRAEGRGLEWREAAAYASRSRGQRRRPRHGWASLTPTEVRVVDLVVEGLTNPQIAQRLLIGSATVKSHLEHVFTKTDVRTRSELAVEAVRRRSTNAATTPPSPAP